MDKTKSFFAATGLSKSTDLMKAVAEATGQMMAKFDAAGKKPKAVLFIERIEGNKITPGDKDKLHIPHDIGAAIKQATGGAKVFGTGGCGAYGITWGKDVKDNDSTFIIMGLTGSDLEVNGYVDGGQLSASGPGMNTIAGARTGDPTAWESIRREKIQRSTCRLHGVQMGLQIPLLQKPGVIIIVGAVHNSYHTTYVEGIREAIPPRTPLIAGVGQWEDYVYCDGLKFYDRTNAANETVCGRMALTIAGTDFDMGVYGGECCNKSGVESIDRHTADCAMRMRDSLGGKNPEAMISFSCVTRLRDSKIMDPSVLTAMMDKHFFQNDAGAELFGCFCGGEVYAGMWGDYTAGGDRLVSIGFRAK